MREAGNVTKERGSYFRKRTMRLVLVPLKLLFTPQQLAVFVNFWSLMQPMTLIRISHGRPLYPYIETVSLLLEDKQFFFTGPVSARYDRVRDSAGTLAGRGWHCARLIGAAWYQRPDTCATEPGTSGVRPDLTQRSRPG